MWWGLAGGGLCRPKGGTNLPPLGPHPIKNEPWGLVVPKRGGVSLEGVCAALTVVFANRLPQSKLRAERFKVQVVRPVRDSPHGAPTLRTTSRLGGRDVVLNLFWDWVLAAP